MKPSDYTREYVRREFSPIKDPELIVRRSPPELNEDLPPGVVAALVIVVLSAVSLCTALMMVGR